MVTPHVGHCGTLDPMAEGLMVMLLNEATKLSQYILERDKTYELEARLGVTTDTLDTTGEILAEKPVEVSIEQVKEAIEKLQGDLSLPIPAYSAVKVKGKKLYEYAREGNVAPTPRRSMRFFDLKLLDFDGRSLRCLLSCSKGSYVRAWIHALGEHLGCGASMSGLKRTFSTPYSLEQAISLQELEDFVRSGRSWEECSAFVPMPSSLPQFKQVRVKGLDQRLLSNGQISHDLRRQLISVYQPEQDQGVKVLGLDERLLALVGLEKDRGFVIRRVFRY